MASEGGAVGPSPLDIEMDVFTINVLVEKCFSLSFKLID